MTATDPLQGHRYLSLATFRKNGTKIATPVWFAEDGGKLYVFSAGDAGKVKRLRNSSRAEVAPCTVRGKLLGDWIAATAMLVDDDASEERAYRALRSKYGVQMWFTDLMSRIAGRIAQRQVIVITVGGGHDDDAV